VADNTNMTPPCVFMVIMHRLGKKMCGACKLVVLNHILCFVS